ncbi:MULTISPECIES: O-methyltransferase [unclassified Paenibacillus]|jgi:predicted O-methyltransferase YrrM|uniref:O-methyltransferase n=1 Tax=unclassified Paenibacillus TaxID=185978 RepID=UPI00277E3020|nr:MULTISPECIES: O-methyltransferase [unclassified Paenibacillus]MDF2652014.1 acyl-CoA O-methyltransferase-like protein [Paenibacillus sp.]MDQ0897195.1 caffeoyl-CoA O-methyltransferase [Paenibacillus sp. V4I7]MDQ0916657.1 caffeoyl-CoA O-methyltransferase [Paenibacillus sp. V4I5]
METITAESYMEGLYEEDTVLERVKEVIRTHNMPEISIAPGYGRLLTMLVTMIGATKVLEVGALGGYSGICLARGLKEGGKLISLELKQEFADVAKQNVTEAGLGELVEYRIGEALIHLNELLEQGERFDFFFIDADKVNYPNYLELAIKLANPGAIIAGDNTLMRGKVVDANQTKASVQAMRTFNQLIATDPRLESTILPAYDGLALARVK